MAVAIQFENLTKRFQRPKTKSLTALNQLTLSIETGQIFGLLGPNGSGKTTSVNLLCGLLKPTEGRVLVHGIDVAQNGTQVRALLGVVPQETALYNDLTAIENLTFHARLYRLPSSVHQSRISEVLDLVGLTSRKDDRVGTYSGGMQRRLTLARALLVKPEVIVLDEPTLGVDVQSRAVLWERIRQIANDGKTVLLTTNYMEEAQVLADRLGIIDNGQLIAQGTPEKLQSQVGGGFIEIEAAFSPDDVNALRQLSDITDLVWEPPHVRLNTKNTRDLMGQVISYLQNSDVDVQIVTMRQPDLNDVFLQLTGRGLRD